MIIHAAFQTMMENTSDMMFVKNMDLKYVAVSQPFVKMTGKENAEELINKTDYEIFEDENLAIRYVADDKKLLSEGKDLINYMEPITTKEGQARYGSTSKYILRDSQGNAIGILGITKDVTLDYFTRLHYQQELKYLFELPEDTYAVAYIDVDDWRIISRRRQMIDGTTLQSCYTVEELTRIAVESMKDPSCDAAEFYRNFTKECLSEIYQKGKRHLSFKYQRQMPDGNSRWVKNEVRFLNDVDSNHLCLMLSARDIDAEKKKEQTLEAAAKMDRLTMLLNRETTVKLIEQTLHEQPEHMHALFMVDIDNFKALNDTLGHQAGDEFLIALGEEIRSCFRESDVKGRIGGDEFFVFVRNVPNEDIVKRKAEELLARILKLALLYPDLHVSGSIGISLYPYHGNALEELYAKADTALYQAKRNGKNQFIIISK